jgi:hypothetical protein
MMEGLRKQVGNYFLERKRKSLKRNSEPSDLESAKSAMILCNMDDRNEMEGGEALLKFLLNKGMQVDLVAYTSKKELPENLIGDEHRHYFTRKDQSFFYQPNPPALLRLIRKGHDILFDLNMGDSFPLTFVLASSNAKFKVGRKRKDKIRDLDFMIELKEGDGVHQLIKHITEYLNIFRK